MQQPNFNSVPLVPKVPAYSPTNSDLKVPYQNVSLVVPVTPKEDYPVISRYFKSITATNNTQTLITVPQGKIFLLISAHMSVVCDAAAGSQAKIYGPGSSDELLEFNSYAAASDAGIYELHTDPCIPVIYRYGDVIYVKSQSTSLHATGSIFGYLLDNFSPRSQVKMEELLIFKGFINIFK